MRALRLHVGIFCPLRFVEQAVKLTCSAFSRQTFLEGDGLWKGRILLFELVRRQVVRLLCGLTPL